MVIAIPTLERPKQVGALIGSFCSLQTESLRKGMWRVVFSGFKAQSSFLEGAKEAGRDSLHKVNGQLVMEMICFPSLGYLENTYG